MKAGQCWLDWGWDHLRKAVDRAELHGGWSEEELPAAREAIQLADLVANLDLPHVAEEQQREVFAEYMEVYVGFLAATNLDERVEAAQTAGSGLFALLRLVGESKQQAHAAAYARTERKHGLSERQLRAVVAEGQRKKWPFREGGEVPAGTIIDKAGVAVTLSPGGAGWLMWLPSGTIVTEVEAQGEYLRVTVPDGRTGWVPRHSVWRNSSEEAVGASPARCCPRCGRPVSAQAAACDDCGCALLKRSGRGPPVQQMSRRSEAVRVTSAET